MADHSLAMQTALVMRRNRIEPEIPRTLELMANEAKNLKAGQDLTLTVKAHVKSTHDDGTAIVSIKEIAGGVQREEPQKPILVRPVMEAFQ